MHELEEMKRLADEFFKKADKFIEQQNCQHVWKEIECHPKGHTHQCYRCLKTK